MKFAYDYNRLNALLKVILEHKLSQDAWKWLRHEGQVISEKNDVAKFNIAFVAMPRKTGKALIAISADEEQQIQALRKNLTLKGWTAERLSRVWLLMQLPAEERERYISVIENLFISGEMSELVALYSSLPLLAYPESWRKRCAEGIRSNIGQVLESVICNNPFPAEVLDEPAWNQLVLKAIFTDQPVLEIAGLRERRNANLAQSLTDYAHERWAAHRKVNPLLWICVSPFIGSGNFSDIQRVFQSDDRLEREAAALACYESNYEPAHRLMEQDPEMRDGIVKGEITWERIAEDGG